MRVANAGGERIQRFMTGHRDGFADVEEALEAIVAYNPDRPRSRDLSGLRRNLREGADGRLYWHWDPRMLDVSPSSEPPSRLEEIVQASAGVTVPTLVIRGDRSDIVDDEGVEEMRHLVPQTEVHQVAGAGHMIAGDKNDAFSAAVLSFLRRTFPSDARRSSTKSDGIQPAGDELRRRS